MALKSDILKIHYGFHPTPFGVSLIGLMDRDVCYLSFVEGSRKLAALQELKRKWPKAQFLVDQKKTKKVIEQIFAQRRKKKTELKLQLSGSPFQLKVWLALMALPVGSVISYQDLASLIGSPRASRAVGSALAKNTIAYLVPCHRVVNSTGALGNYRWGKNRKLLILTYEGAITPS